MLQSIRNGARGWLSAIIITLLILSFGIFGGAASFGGGSEPNIAKVDGEDITLREYQDRYQSSYRQQQQRLGENFAPELINEPQLKQSVLEGLVSGANLRAWVNAQEYAVTDSQLVNRIQEGVFFEEDGVFSIDRYKQFLSRIGQTQGQYESGVRENLKIGQVSAGLRETGSTAAAEVTRLYRVEKQTRDVQTATLLVNDIAKTIEIAEADIGSYYEDNQGRFYTAERVKADYLEVIPEEVAGSIVLDAGAVRAEYDNNLSRFGVDETRRASHILLTNAEFSDDEAIAKLEGVKAKVIAGEEFAGFAKQLSEDPGSGKLGGDLNWSARGRMVPEFDEVMFSLAEAGTLSDVVKTEYGYHLIQLTDIRPASTEPFEDVRSQLESELSERQAQTKLADLSVQLQELTYDNPESLDVAAQALGLSVQTSDWFSRAEGLGIAQFARVRAASFDGIVLNDNDNSDVITLESGGMVVVRKNSYESPELQSLDDVRSEIVAVLQINKARRVAIAKLVAVTERIKQGQKLSEASLPSNAFLSDTYVISRGANELPTDAVNAAFELSRPEGDVASYTSVERANGDQVIVVVTAVTDGDPSKATEAESDQLRARVSQSRGYAETASVLRAIRTKADVKIWEERL
jgi:peptidyl-prolyl cis-trans isomerase D